MSASMAEVVAALIRKAMLDHRVVWELTGNPRDIHEAVAKCKSCAYLGSELETFEHQANIAAEQLAANGYGKLPEPVAKWGAAFRANGNPYNYHHTKAEAEDFVKSMNEVDADMVVITRQHTPATNTEWIPA